MRIRRRRSIDQRRLSFTPGSRPHRRDRNRINKLRCDCAEINIDGCVLPASSSILETSIPVEYVVDVKANSAKVDFLTRTVSHSELSRLYSRAMQRVPLLVQQTCSTLLRALAVTYEDTANEVYEVN